MRRWNGWGHTQTDYPLPEEGAQFLREHIGDSTPAPEVAAEQAQAEAPAGRLDYPGQETDPLKRIRHAHGESYPDWLALKHGRWLPLPDAVVYPESHEDVRRLLDRALREGTQVLPYGGGTSVCGHLRITDTDRPALCVDLSRMNQLLAFEPRSRLARFGAGTPGPQLEAQLQAQGYTLGHYPQSFEYSTVGGWVVTRSSGQQSLRYGRIEQLFAGGRMATPVGDWEIPTIPASSAGPDLREQMLGSEGRAGILTEATMRVRPVAEQEHFHALFYPDWSSASEAARALTQAGLPLSMLRLSNALETRTQLALAGKPAQIAWLQRYLRLRGAGGEGQCLMFVGLTGTRTQCRRLLGDTLSLARPHGAVHVGRGIGRGWAKNRFHGPYLRNTLWAQGYGADTCETSVDWPRVTPMMEAIEQAAREAFAGFGERVHAFTHLSHVYGQGSSVYSTFVFRATPDYEENLARWQALKRQVSEAIVGLGGTISHQHGVGKDHAPWLQAEKGALGLAAIRHNLKAFDPQGLMTPGTLVADD